MTAVVVDSSMVLRALWQLHDLLGRWPTTDEVAGYLEVPRTAVRAPLFALRDERLFRPRHRDGRKVWLPWEES